MFCIDELEDNGAVPFHNIDHEDNDHNDLNSCADHDEKQDDQLSMQQIFHIVTVIPRKKGNIRNFGSVH